MLIEAMSKLTSEIYYKHSTAGKDINSRFGFQNLAKPNHCHLSAGRKLPVILSDDAARCTPKHHIQPNEFCGKPIQRATEVLFGSVSDTGQPISYC